MTWQEGIARATIGMLLTIALFLVLAPRDDPAGVRVPPCSAYGRAAVTACHPHR